MSDNQSLDQEALRHRLNEVPGGMKSHVQMGFHLLARIDSAKTTALIDYVIERMTSGRELEPKRGIEISGLNENTIHDVFTAVTFAGFSVLDLDVTSDDFVAYISPELVRVEERSLAKSVAERFVSSRAVLKSGIDAGQLARSVLPVFRALNIEVDLRFSIADEKVEHAVPVAVAHIATDNKTDELFVQFGLDEIDKMIRGLEEARAKMGVVSKIKYKND